MVGSTPGRVKPRAIKLAFVFLRTQHFVSEQNNVSELGNMSTCTLYLIQSANIIEIQLSVLV